MPDDDGDLLGGEQEQVLGVDVLDPLAALHVLVPGDGVAQRLEPAEEERLDVGQLRGEVAVEHLALELAVLLGGARPGLRLRLDLALPQPPVPVSPRCSQRIRSAYDGVHLGSVERAAKRKAAASGYGSSSGLARCSSSSRQKKARAAALAGLL